MRYLKVMKSGNFRWEKEMCKINSCFTFLGSVLSASWPSWYKETSNFYGFWELLVSEEVYILFEEPWDSGDAVAMREVYTFAIYQNAKIHF